MRKTFRKKPTTRSGRRIRQWQGPAALAVGRAARAGYNVARKFGMSRKGAYGVAAAAGVGGGAYAYKNRKTGTAPVSLGNDMSRSSKVVGRYPALKPNRLLQLIKCGMTERLDRFQGITNFDTNCGYFTIANREDSTNGTITTPLHSYNLTNFANTNTSGTPVLGQAYGWDGPTGTANIVEYTLQGMDSTGSGGVTGWTAVNSRGPSTVATATQTPLPNADKIMHEYTSVNMNLYGMRFRPCWFNIDFVRVKNEYCNFSTANTANARFKELISALTTSHTYSNLQSRDQKALKFLTFVKRFRYYIPPENSTDLNTATGRIKHVKIFMKHGKILDMTAHETRADAEFIGHYQADGADYETGGSVLNTCAEGQQLFMLVRAWSPTRAANTAVGWFGVGVNYAPLVSNVWNAKPVATAIASDVPSYDMVLTNKWTAPN